MREAWRDLRWRSGALILGAMVLIALLAPWITGGDPALTRDVVATRYLPPLSTDPHGAFHLLGTDKLGRDVWTRLAYGARISLSVGVLGVLLSLFIGVLVGTLSGAGRGAGSKLLMAGTDFALALPRVVILLLLATLWAPGALLVIIVLGVTGWMPIARLVHGEVRRIMAGSYVDGAVALGARRSRVLLRHVLPNAMTPVIAAAALGVGNAISLEAGLSFLGLGVQPPAPSWGSMIASGRDALINAPWVALAPGLALILVVVACTLLGDGWRGPGHRGQRELTP